MSKRYCSALLVLFLVLDLCYSFWQHSQATISGDLSNIVGPAMPYEWVLHDPLGLRALRGESYSAPNRFFQHQFIYQYFRLVPIWLQQWFSPITSLYVACATVKTLVQALLIFLLGTYISGRATVWNRQWLVAAALVTPLFHANGWTGQIGIVDTSVVYSLCYAFPVALLMLFFLPYARPALHGRPWALSVWGGLGLLALAPVLALNSPVASGVIAVVCPGLLLYLWARGFSAAGPGEVWQRGWRAIRALPLMLTGPVVLVTVLCLYSLYIGRLNAENFTTTLPVAERYARLPLGLYYQFTQKIGWPLLLGLLATHYWLLRRLPDTAAKKRLLTALRWIEVFAAVYIVLLPLGGYRVYRPYIVRRDTLLPVIIAVVYWYGATAFYLLRHLAGRPRQWYQAGLALVLLLFTVTDRAKPHENDCEQQALRTLAAATTPVVVLDTDCPVLDWETYSTPEASATNAAMLHYWRVTPRQILYYHRPR